MSISLRLALAAFLVVATATRARAFDASLEHPELRPLELASSPSVSISPPVLTVARQPADLAAPPSAQLRHKQVSLSFADRRARRQIAGAGFGVAVGLGVLLGWVSLAAQTRPNKTDLYSGVCYDQPPLERRFLFLATGVMAVGLTLSSSMLTRLIRLRHAHPGVQPSRAARIGQPFIGLGTAALLGAALFFSTMGCQSS